MTELQKQINATQAELDRLKAQQAVAEPKLEDIKIGMSPEVREAVFRKIREVLDNR